MDSNLSYIDSVRKGNISRRGGVRTRGGRLPPIRIGNVTISTANKKAITPNIPQRRNKVKPENVESKESCSVRESIGNGNTRGRGRGRGLKVYLQTEGSFLGEGPAIRTKREQQTSFYDRSCYVSSSRAKTVDQVKVESSKIDNLLENYDDKEAFCDSDFKPVRLPFPKLEKSEGLKSVTQKDIKTEDIKPKDFKTEDIKPKDIKTEDIKPKDIKTEDIKPNDIKTEDIKTEDIKPFIKQEPIDDEDDEWNALIEKYCVKVKKEDDLDMKKPPFLQDFKIFQDEKVLLLMQFPSLLPFAKPNDPLNKEKSSSEKNAENALETKKEDSSGVSVRDLTEGYFGKLQLMKSGHMRILAGSVVLALEEGVDSQSKLEAASIPIENRNEGELIMLGKIGSKLVLRPHLKYMMDRPHEEDVCSRSNTYSQAWF